MRRLRNSIASRAAAEGPRQSSGRAPPRGASRSRSGPDVPPIEPAGLPNARSTRRRRGGVAGTCCRSGEGASPRLSLTADPCRFAAVALLRQFTSDILDYYQTDREAFWRSGETGFKTIPTPLHSMIATAATVLVIGCRIGRMTRTLADRAATVIGLDISTEMLRNAAEPNPGLEKRRVVTQRGVGPGGGRGQNDRSRLLARRPAAIVRSRYAIWLERPCAAGRAVRMTRPGAARRVSIEVVEEAARSARMVVARRIGESRQFCVVRREKTATAVSG